MGVHHFKDGETKSKEVYRIKDDMSHEITVSEWYNSQWNAFKTDDLQFEAVMLDPYVRKTLKLKKGVAQDSHATRYVTHYRLPDHYGVFTLKVEYNRHGYSSFKKASIVEVRPFRHNEYPRFLVTAYPYYVNSFSLMVGFLLVSVVFLFHAEQKEKPKKA
jgi:oligosaccharyltransferase complex subunit beta